jgi:hypothetical protein
MSRITLAVTRTDKTTIRGAEVVAGRHREAAGSTRVTGRAGEARITITTTKRIACAVLTHAGRVRSTVYQRQASGHMRRQQSANRKNRKCLPSAHPARPNHSLTHPPPLRCESHVRKELLSFAAR